MRVYYNRMLGDRHSLVQKTRKQETLLLIQAQNHLWSIEFGDGLNVIPQLVLVHRLRFPRFLFRDDLRLDVAAALRDVGIVWTSASSGPIGIRIHQHSPRLACQRVTYIEDHAISTHYWQRRTVPIGDRAGRRDKGTGENTTHHPNVSSRSNRYPRSKTGLSRKLRRIFTSDE